VSEVGIRAAELADAAVAGDRRALARLLTAVENRTAIAEAALKRLYPSTGRAHLVGITGAPGAGKSTLVAALIAEARLVGRAVAVVAVDPSSPITGGALLGDRVRMQAYASDDGVFIRSMASRGHAGGLAATSTSAATVLDAAGFDLVLLETVGTGQSEVEVAATADTTVVLEAPDMGDEVQAIKAGLLEVADIVVVNKGDRPGAQRTAAQLRAMLTVTAWLLRRATRLPTSPGPSGRKSSSRPPRPARASRLSSPRWIDIARPAATGSPPPHASPEPKRRSGRSSPSGSGVASTERPPGRPRSRPCVPSPNTGSTRTRPPTGCSHPSPGGDPGTDTASPAAAQDVPSPVPGRAFVATERSRVPGAGRSGPALRALLQRFDRPARPPRACTGWTLRPPAIQPGAVVRHGMHRATGERSFRSPDARRSRAGSSPRPEGATTHCLNLVQPPAVQTSSSWRRSWGDVPGETRTRGAAKRVGQLILQPWTTVNAIA
jgi:LAO/AO transport system ATPase